VFLQCFEDSTPHPPTLYTQGYVCDVHRNARRSSGKVFAVAVQLQSNCSSPFGFTKYSSTVFLKISPYKASLNFHKKCVKMKTFLVSVAVAENYHVLNKEWAYFVVILTCC